MTDVLLATCASLSRLTGDDRLLVDQLARSGFRAHPAVWDDGDVDWGGTRCCIVRSTWDYHLDRDRFLTWVDQASALTRVENAPSLLRWSSHKRYLLDLESAGVPIVPTVWIGAGESVELGGILDQAGWSEAILKPAVGASGHGASRLSRSSLSPQEAQPLNSAIDQLVQPVVASVAEHGEIAVIAVEGEITHAARRWASRESSEPYALQPAERRVAEVALAACPEEPLYARIDLVARDDGQPLVLELELVEPELFLRHGDGAAARLADAIASRL